MERSHDKAHNGTGESQSHDASGFHTHSPGGSRKLTMKFVRVTWSKCKNKGHNARTCNGQTGTDGIGASLMSFGAYVSSGVIG